MSVADTLDSRILRLRQYGDRLTCREIAAELGITESRVYSAMRRAEMQRRCRGMDKRTRDRVTA
jgi:DNA-binding Lrp family transcriptional regulator